MKEPEEAQWQLKGFLDQSMYDRNEVDSCLYGQACMSAHTVTRPFDNRRRHCSSRAEYRAYVFGLYTVGMADREGFEPSVRFHAHTRSRRAP